jgi:hypothetical protein
MLGAGAGKELANWIVDGRPEFDLYGYDIRRFCPEVSRSKQWVKERSHEAYAKNYSMVFTHDEPLAGRNMKKDPLHEELSTNGCVFQVNDYLVEKNPMRCTSFFTLTTYLHTGKIWLGTSWMVQCKRSSCSKL